jgi:tRNA-Thr(GGU) m(6)t(6)A37 methyltransferase TsaA
VSARGPIELEPVGTVVSPLADLEDAPKQGDEGAPDAWIEFEPAAVEGLRGIEQVKDLPFLPCLDRARRDVLAVHPRSDPSRALQGVFGTRSPDRPNPIGLHRVTVLAVDGGRLRVGPLEALDGTPVIDVKPVLERDVALR